MAGHNMRTAADSMNWPRLKGERNKYPGPGKDIAKRSIENSRKQCMVDDCDKPRRTIGKLCEYHWSRNKTYGSPTLGMAKAWQWTKARSLLNRVVRKMDSGDKQSWDIWTQTAAVALRNRCGRGKMFSVKTVAAREYRAVDAGEIIISNALWNIGRDPLDLIMAFADAIVLTAVYIDHMVTPDSAKNYRRMQVGRKVWSRCGLPKSKLVPQPPLWIPLSWHQDGGIYEQRPDQRVPTVSGKRTLTVCKGTGQVLDEVFSEYVGLKWFYQKVELEVARMRMEGELPWSAPVKTAEQKAAAARARSRYAEYFKQFNNSNSRNRR
jgi:hypothetical protein